MDETTNTVAPVAEENVAVPAKFKKIVEEIETMSVLDLNELVKVFEKKFGVSAAASFGAAPAAGAGAAAAEEKSTFTVELTDGGAQKIAVIKVVKEALNLGLKDAKDKVDGAPAVLAADMKKEDAEALKKAIEEAGGKVTLK
jgi:large subunit ribosomal protein L7/L12